MRNKFVVHAGLTCLLVVCVLATAGRAEEWEFSGVTRIRVDGVSGDVIVRPAEGSRGLVRLRAHVRPQRAFEPRVEQDGTTLHIDERWRGGNSSGKVEWTIYLPRQDKEPRIRISTASGTLDCKGISARIDLDTASGDVELIDVELGDNSDLSTASGDYTIENMTVREGTEFSTASGDIELYSVAIEEGCEFSTASGDIKCTECTGYMELSSASGDVVVKDSKITGNGKFSSASGNVSLHLDELPGEDLSASSASGRVLLDVEDFGDSYTLVMIKREDRGRIICPFDFTSERIFEDHHTYEEKVVERGSGWPEIELRTASGKVIVKN